MSEHDLELLRLVLWIVGPPVVVLCLAACFAEYIAIKEIEDEME